jgi:hypothetical protein
MASVSAAPTLAHPVSAVANTAANIITCFFIISYSH